MADPARCPTCDRPVATGTAADREAVRSLAATFADACFDDVFYRPYKTRADLVGRLTVAIATAAWKVSGAALAAARAEGARAQRAADLKRAEDNSDSACGGYAHYCSHGDDIVDALRTTPLVPDAPPAPPERTSA